MSAFRDRIDALRASGVLPGSIAELYTRICALRNAHLEVSRDALVRKDRARAARHLRSARQYNRLARDILAEYAVEISAPIAARQTNDRGKG